MSNNVPFITRGMHLICFSNTIDLWHDLCVSDEMTNLYQFHLIQMFIQNQNTADKNAISHGTSAQTNNNKENKTKHKDTQT